MNRYSIREWMSRRRILLGRLGLNVTRALIYDIRRAHEALTGNTDPNARGFLDGSRLLGHDPDARWEDLCGMVYVPRDEANMSRVPEHCRPGHDGRAASIDRTGD